MIQNNNLKDQKRTSLNNTNHALKLTKKNEKENEDKREKGDTKKKNHRKGNIETREKKNLLQHQKLVLHDRVNQENIEQNQTKCRYLQFPSI